MSEFRIINNKNNKIFSVVRRPVVFTWERSFQVSPASKWGRKVAVAGFVVAAMGVWFFAVANGAEAAFSCDKFQVYA